MLVPCREPFLGRRLVLRGLLLFPTMWLFATPGFPTSCLQFAGKQALRRPFLLRDWLPLLFFVVIHDLSILSYLLVGRVLETGRVSCALLLGVAVE